MKTTDKNFYHVLEDHGLGVIGWQGFYLTEKEAQKEADKLSSNFDCYYSVFKSESKKQPKIVTI